MQHWLEQDLNPRRTDRKSNVYPLHYRATIPQVSGEWQNWGCLNSETPESTAMKFDVGDCISHVSLHAKIQSESP